MKEYITPNGKAITIFHEGFSLRIKFKKGGELPEELAGKFTAADHAENAILKYLDKLKQKLKKPKE